MYKVILALGFALFANVSLAADASFEKRLEASKCYLSVMPVSSMWADVTDKMMATMAAGQREAFASIMEQIDLSRLENIMLNAMARHFTLEEINALTEFYSSPIGRSAMEKFGSYMADINPAIQAELQTALLKAMQQAQ